MDSSYPVLFGVPAVLRIKPGMTAEKLYWLVWRQCMHMVPEYDPVDPQAPWPFNLARTNRSGVQWGHWLEGSTGELIPPDQQPIPEFDSDLETIAVDWNMEVHTEFYNDRTTGQFEVHRSVELCKAKELRAVQLSDCMKTFTTPESVTAYCPDCTKKNDGEYMESPQEKTICPYKLPPVLIITLKRFKNRGHYGQKLTNLVEFPVQGLDLEQYLADDNIVPDSPTMRAVNSELSRCPSDVKDLDEVPCYLSRENTVYDLYGVVNHEGALGGGHYYAFINGGDGVWRCYNDDKITVEPESSIVSRNAYILFYQRRDMTDFEGKILPASGGLPIDMKAIKQTKWQRPVSTKDKKEQGGSCLLM